MVREVTADEIVTGSFRNVAGTVNSVDANAGTLSVQDLLSKKPIPVKITRGVATAQTATRNGADDRDAA